MLTPLVLLAGIGALMATLAVAVRDAILTDPTRRAASTTREATAAFRVATAPASTQSAVILAFAPVPARPDRSATRARELSLTHAA